MGTKINDSKVYLGRMAMPIADKLRAANYISAKSKNILDVGCADGALTLALAKIFPKINFLGIDLNSKFIKEASKNANKANLINVKFKKIYLRDLLMRPRKFDAILFTSVLHEFFTYGEGISSVLKALADAHELLRPGSEIIIRDMILDKYTKDSKLKIEDLIYKVKINRNYAKEFVDFEKRFGQIENLYSLNHFLLKYMYKENWRRELNEYYVPVTFDEYENIFKLLGMEILIKDSYLLKYLKEKWKADFNFTDEELASFRSTGFLIAKK